MSKATKLWAKRRRTEQIAELGGCCAVCGTKDELQRDCIVPQGDEHHRMSTDARTSFYNRQMKWGNVQLLCPSCHATKTAEDMKNTSPKCPPGRHSTFLHELRRRASSCPF
jgi:5-methylcytosine-specific restriction endonuclease McrA